MKLCKNGDLIIKFDDDLWDFIGEVTGWSVGEDGNGRLFVRCTKAEHSGRTLARVLLNAPQEMFVDHINGDPLDNRLENLRLVTVQQNLFNRLPYKNKKSGLPKGVVLMKRNGMYKAKITIHSTSYHLGVFKTIEEADAAYKKAAEKYFGDYAVHISRK